MSKDRGKITVQDVPEGQYAISAQTDGFWRGIEVVAKDFRYQSKGSAMSLRVDEDEGITRVQAYSDGKNNVGALLLNADGGDVVIGKNGSTVNGNLTVTETLVLPKNPNPSGTVPPTPALAGQVYWDESSIWVFTGIEWEKCQIGPRGKPR